MVTYLRNNSIRITVTVATIAFAIVSLIYMTDNAKSILHRLGIGTSKETQLADTSCTVPRTHTNEVYFVSCSGFF